VQRAFTSGEFATLVARQQRPVERFSGKIAVEGTL
jgi:hypothetical protein